MPLDPNIIMQVNPPLDASQPIMNAMKMKDLMIRSQEAQTKSQLANQEMTMNQFKINQASQDQDDRQAIRQAYKDNTTFDANGLPVINMQGLNAQVAKQNPALVPKMMLDQRQAQLDQLNQTHAMAKEILSGIHDQASQDEAIKQAQALGLPDLGAKLPATYDPNMVKTLRDSNLTAGEKLAQENKQQEFALQKSKNDIEIARLNLDLKKNSADQNQQTLQALQSARGNPAVQQAEKDVYSAAKINSLKDQVKSLDQMSPQQVSLLAHETLKMASGGQGTEDELKSIKPGTPQYALADLGQKLKNAPVGAKAGAFARQLVDYANSMAGDAKNLLKQNYQGIIETKKPYLAPGDYQNFNKQFMDRLSGNVAPGDWSPGGQKAAPGKAATATSTAASKGGVMSFDEWKASQK